MKYLITIVLAFIVHLSNAQISGIPEQDSLLELKDELFLKVNEQMRNDDPNWNDTFECLLWVKYQWIQWVRTPKKPMEYYIPERGDPFFTPAGFGVKCVCEKRDTFVKTPPVITYEGFMDWRIKNVLKQ